MNDQTVISVQLDQATVAGLLAWQVEVYDHYVKPEGGWTQEDLYKGDPKGAFQQLAKRTINDAPATHEDSKLYGAILEALKAQSFHGRCYTCDGFYDYDLRLCDDGGERCKECKSFHDEAESYILKD